MTTLSRESGRPSAPERSRGASCASCDRIRGWQRSIAEGAACRDPPKERRGAKWQACTECAMQRPKSGCIQRLPSSFEQSDCCLEMVESQAIRPIRSAASRPKPLLPEGTQPSGVRCVGALDERPKTSQPFAIWSAVMPSPLSTTMIVPPDRAVFRSTTQHSVASASQAFLTSSKIPLSSVGFSSSPSRLTISVENLSCAAIMVSATKASRPVHAWSNGDNAAARELI